MKKRKLIIYIFLSIFLVLAIAFYFFVYPMLPILNGHAAKNMCSCVFVANIPEETVRKQELGFSPMFLASIKIDEKEKSVTSSVFGLASQKAYYREGLGCALFHNKKPSEEKLSLKVNKIDSLENYFDCQAQKNPKILNQEQERKLEAALDWAFRTENPEKLFTRATLVIYKGQLVAESYAEGFDRKSLFMGWSMTKGITTILYGVLVKEGKLSLDDPLKIPEWKGTPKEKITYRNLLNMQSGLAWVEDYGKPSDVTRMLYQSNNLGKKASQSKVAFPANKQWEYSSGTSNILAYALSFYFPDKKSYQKFPYEALLHKIGAYSILLETDASGFFVGSSYAWATARDWAKLGLLMLNNGKWNGETIIDKEFVDFIRKPLPNALGHYGAGFWLNNTTDLEKYMPDIPKDAYSFRGFHAQRIEIIPSKDLVIVRLGETHNELNFDFNIWLKMIIDALEE